MFARGGYGNFQSTLAKIVNEKKAIFRQYRDLGKDATGAELIELIPLNSNYAIHRVRLNKESFIIARLVTHLRTH